MLCQPFLELGGIDPDVLPDPDGREFAPAHDGVQVAGRDAQELRDLGHGQQSGGTRLGVCSGRVDQRGSQADPEGGLQPFHLGEQAGDHRRRQRRRALGVRHQLGEVNGHDHECP